MAESCNITASCMVESFTITVSCMVESFNVTVSQQCCVVLIVCKYHISAVVFALQTEEIITCFMWCNMYLQWGEVVLSFMICMSYLYSLSFTSSFVVQVCFKCSFCMLLNIHEVYRACLQVAVYIYWHISLKMMALIICFMSV